MTGICNACGKSWRVPGYRGSKLSEMRSHCCGAPMHVPTARKNIGKRTYVLCEVCRNRRSVEHSAINVAIEPFKDLWGKEHPAGTIYCRFHTIERNGQCIAHFGDSRSAEYEIKKVWR